MSTRIPRVIAGIRRVAPYLAIELILPGGSLVALTLWLLKNRPALRQRLARLHSRARTALQLVAIPRPSTASTL
ncbi:MAG: hypothetical protein ACRETR_09010 [Steroidobacteraceae bacterium]